jgi:hypothetical protein
MTPVFHSKIKNIINEIRLTRVFLLVGLFLLMSGKGWGQLTATISGDTTVCQGAGAPDITFTGANGTAPYIFTYTINSGSELTVSTTVSDSSVTISVSAETDSTFIYNLVSVTDAGSNTEPATGSVTVTVNPLPDAAGTITGIPAVCQGQAGVNYSVPAIANATDYIWTLPDGATISAGANTNSITVNFSASAISGDIKVQGSNGCGTGTVSANYSVTVNPLPTTSLIYHF